MIHEIAVGAKLTALAVAALLVYAASLYRYPFRPCVWCKGTGLRKGSDSRRHGYCRRCRGNKQVQRLGSRTVHRLAWAIRGEWSRARVRRAEQKAADRAAHPTRSPTETGKETASCQRSSATHTARKAATEGAAGSRPWPSCWWPSSSRRGPSARQPRPLTQRPAPRCTSWRSWPSPWPPRPVWPGWAG